MKKIILLIAIICSYIITQASHLAGGEIWYSHISDSTYKVHYRTYRDCSGIPAATIEILRYRSVSLGIDSSTYMPQDTFYYNNTCPNTSCEIPSSNLLGIEIREYSALVILRPAPDWQMQVTPTGARNPSNNLSGTSSTNYNMYIEATLDNSTLPNNATFPYAAINMRQNSSIQSNFNFPMLDPDGDVLEIEFTSPLSNLPVPPSYFNPQQMTYVNGATINNPFVSIPAPSLNSATGNITLNPCLQGDFNFAVIIKEYRNNKLIGTAMRDYLFSFEIDSNQPPTLTGINNTFLIDTTIEVCPTNNFTFAVHSTDSNLTDSTFIFCISKPTGATFAAIQSQNQIGYFYWTPGLAEVRTQPYIVVFKVKDNQCAEQSYGYRVYVKQCSNLSIKNEQNESVVKLYPNPSHNSMTFEMLEYKSGTDYSYSIMDVSGRTLRSGVIKNKKTHLNVSSFPSGLYFLELTRNRQRLGTFNLRKE